MASTRCQCRELIVLVLATDTGRRHVVPRSETHYAGLRLTCSERARSQDMSLGLNISCDESVKTNKFPAHTFIPHSTMSTQPRRGELQRFGVHQLEPPIAITARVGDTMQARILRTHGSQPLPCLLEG